LVVMREMLRTATFDTEKMAAAAGRGFSTATEVADYLVREGVTFREAHGVVGQIVRYCEKQGVTLADLSLPEWKSFHHAFGDDILRVISPAGAAAAKRSPGGTAPERVKDQLAQARKLLG
jgi:argininosuccinate lyase